LEGGGAPLLGSVAVEAKGRYRVGVAPSPHARLDVAPDVRVLHAVPGAADAAGEGLDELDAGFGAVGPLPLGGAALPVEGVQARLPRRPRPPAGPASGGLPGRGVLPGAGLRGVGAEGGALH